MKTCEDCIHYNVCGLEWYDKWPIIFCRDFIDKSHFIESPCKVGDTVYYLYSNGIGNVYILEATVSGVVIEHYEHYKKICLKIVYKDLDGNSDRSNAIYGSRVFLTKIEAKARLKELRK